jgi:hypothetical protein
MVVQDGKRGFSSIGKPLTFFARENDLGSLCVSGSSQATPQMVEKPPVSGAGRNQGLFEEKVYGFQSTAPNGHSSESA